MKRKLFLLLCALLTMIGVQAQSYDVTSKYLANAAVTDATGWTNGATANDANWTDRPDDVCLNHGWNTDVTNMFQEITLPKGEYRLTAMTRGHADVSSNIYVYDNDAKSNLASTEITKRGDSGENNGWGETIVDFTITEEKTVTVGWWCGSTKSQQRWANADYFKLYRKTDVTNTYITNAGFDACTAETSDVAAKTIKDYSSKGWTNYETGSYTTIAVTAYGGGKKLATSATPATKKDETTVSGNTLGIIAGWGDVVKIQSGNITLPAGAYTLSVDHYLTSTTNNYDNSSSRFGFVTASESYLVSSTTFTASTWTTETVTFILTEQTIGKVQIGLIGKNKTGSSAPAVFYDDVTLTYSPLADAEDYEALNSAIEAAEAYNLGFEINEYAPYANVEALVALAAAKAIDPSAVNAQSTVQGAKTALVEAVWTKNNAEVNAVYDGNFAIQPEHTTGPTALDGWNNPAGIRQIIKNTETYHGLTSATAQAAVFAWGNTTMKYGETDGYTIPLKGHTIYELSFKTCAWADGDMGYVNVDVKNASNEGLQTVSTVTATKRITEENPWDEFKILFVTGEAGNYKLGMWTSKHTTFTDIVLKKAASQTLTFDDDAAMPAFAPGTYPRVRVNRTLNAGENVWNTLVLPFAYTNADWAVRELSSSTEDNLSFSVVEGGAMTAGKPYLVRPNAAVTYIEAENVAVSKTPPTAVETDKYSFIPVFAPTTITGDGTNYFVATGTNKLYCAKANIATNGYRAYFHYTGTNSGARSVFLNFDETDPTAINAIEAAEAESGALKDGKYIIDNKVVIVKNGVKYSANGQKLN